MFIHLVMLNIMHKNYSSRNKKKQLLKVGFTTLIS